MMRRSLFVASVALLVFAGPGHAAPTRAEATHALAKVKRLQLGKGIRTGHELTPALTQLYEALPALTPADRRQARAILSRPDDMQPDPAGTHKWSGPEGVGSPHCSAHFCVHW